MHQGLPSTSAAPNLFIIGAMKSGTTYLHELLAGHPDIFMATPKEPCFFVDPAELARGWPQMARAGYAGNAERYLDLFAQGEGCRWRGESSTLYTYAPVLSGVPARISAACPHARLIYLMRDPMERTLSHVWHDIRVTGSSAPARRLRRPESEYLAISDYHGQLVPYLDRFGREQVLALTLEALAAQPAETLRTVHRWLDLEPGPVPADLSLPRNVGGGSATVGRFTGAGWYELRQSAPWRLLTAAVPWRVRNALARASERTITRDAVESAEVRAFLRRVQRPQTARLEALLGRDFPEWTTLQGEDH